MDMGDVRGDVTLGGIKGMSDFRGLCFVLYNYYYRGRIDFFNYPDPRVRTWIPSSR